MAITGIGYGRTLMYEIQKRVSEGTLQSASDVASRFAESLEESAEENDKALAPVTRGVRLNRRIEGKDKVPYGEMAEDGVIEYNGVVFVCDYDHNRLTLGDTSNEKDCINIPLSGGGSLLVNRNNIDSLSKAIGMFSPEDVNRILRALAKDKKIREMEKELDDMENGDNVDSNEETSETPDADKAAETDPAGTAGEPEKEDLSLMEQICEKMQEIYDKLQNGDTETKFMIGNQEFSISSKGEALSGKTSILHANAERMNILEALGADVVSLGNEHAAGYGQDALKENMELLKNAGMAYVGAGTDAADAAQPVYLIINGIKIGFTSASGMEDSYDMAAGDGKAGILEYTEAEQYTKVIQEAATKCDYLIVGVNADDLVESYKNKRPIVPLEERAEIVRAIRYVDEVIVTTTLDKKQVWEKVHFNEIYIGDDWKGNARWEKTGKEMEELGAKLVFLPYTKDTSSTMLREKLKEF